MDSSMQRDTIADRTLLRLMIIVQDTITRLLKEASGIQVCIFQGTTLKATKMMLKK
jgi:hypothetical protein